MRDGRSAEYYQTGFRSPGGHPMTGIAISEPDRLILLAGAERLRARITGLSEAARLDFVAEIFAGNVTVIGV
jgi:hypothetical protein